MKTKFGSTRITPNGYVRISSKKEGNEGKLLHRLVFEDFYNISLPENIVIHHNDGDKQNNEIWNLIPLTPEEHNTLHHKGMHHSEKTRKQISESMNGEKNHFYGKHHSDETKAILSEKNSGENHVFFGKNLKIFINVTYP